jgi:ribonuclease HI
MSFTNSQAAMAHIASVELGPGQKYAIDVRRWTRALRKSSPAVEIEIRRCPAHEGIAGNEKVDEWAKLAVEEPDTYGVEWLTRADGYERRLMPQLRSLVNLKWEISEKKWVEARQ